MTTETLTPEDERRFLDEILRRELTPSRSIAALLAGVLVVLLCVYFLLETILALFRLPGWLIDPDEALNWVAGLPGTGPGPVLALGGAVLAMVGFFFLVSALMPGRRARHSLPHPVLAVVVDDEVVASALARRARLAANVSPAQVMVTVARAQVLVNVRPTSGLRVTDDAVERAVTEELDAMGLSPRPSVTVHLASTGVVGA
ncbi:MULTISPECIES: DUF6286 domain-containing protein [Arthrobacter]|uniref:DUF6286 domain-containing protein n=2 Tax=Arthrobacter TaxID=1663 RepID=A0ABU9KI53_9MICC|nr:DUF6286 domain-containing protein [Arthrobacter sp. YJM1]MDP5226427.1 DUF6286 domain-containing protein [Arthrobacter sp. YJM1]